jgi:hypothetical protein
MREMCNFISVYSKIVLQQGTNVEWINVPNVLAHKQDSKCSTLPDYPLDIIGGVDTLIDGQIVICGGAFPPNATEPVSSSCFSLNRELNLWMEFPSMPEVRAYAGAAMVEQGWWVTGENP